MKFAGLVLALLSLAVPALSEGPTSTDDLMKQVLTEYRAKLTAARFESIGIEPTRIYRAEDARSFLADKGTDVESIAPLVDGKFMSAFVRATKPAGTTACCEPACCAN